MAWRRRAGTIALSSAPTAARERRPAEGLGNALIDAKAIDDLERAAALLGGVGGLSSRRGLRPTPPR